MTEFDPEKFEDKYIHYFNELQRAYKNAFEAMNDKYDSQLIHAIDQQILNESEPFFEGNGTFRIDLPPNPATRIQGVIVDDDKLNTVVTEYCRVLDQELQRVFGFSADSDQ